MPTHVTPGRAGVFVYATTGRALAGRLLHNARQVESFCVSHPDQAERVRTAWTDVQALRAHIESTPVRAVPRPLEAA